VVTTTRTKAVLQRLFPRAAAEDANVFAVVDCARDRRIYREMKRGALAYESLFSGALSPALREVAPYLVRLSEDDMFTEYFVEEGWGQAWGICVAGRATHYGVRRHLRTLLRVRAAEGRWLLFRYYDPRVLSVFLPTCSPEQLDQMFGPLLRFDLEGPAGESLVRFRMGAHLGTRRLERQVHGVTAQGGS
jgi:hypothetical protein